MNTTQSWTPARVIFAVLTCVLLLGYLAYIATYSDPSTTGREFVIPAAVWILRTVAAVMAICLGKLWKDKGFLILVAYLFLKVVRIVIPGPEHLFEASVSESLLAGLWAFSACYGLARVFSRKQLKQIRRSFRLLNDRTNRWERMAVPVFISIAVFELVECLTWLRSSQAPMLPFFFVAAGILANSGSREEAVYQQSINEY